MNYRKKSVADIDVAGKKVLVRCEFNVPLDENGNITEDNRIRATLPTIQHLLNHGAAVILCSHLGRPKGKLVPKLSLRPVAECLAGLLGQEVFFTTDIVGKEAAALCQGLQPGQVALLENLRFDPREEKNDPEFARLLASFAEIYVDDAFGTVHRAHASNHGVTAHLPAVCGFLIHRELDIMGRALDVPDRPYVAIVGGAKVSDKLGLIDSLLNQCDAVLVLGGMSYTFDKALGGAIGASLCDESKLEMVKSFLDTAKARGSRIELPVDCVAADAFANDANCMTVPAGQIPDGWIGMDIGPETIAHYRSIIMNAKTILWNGPAGVFEMPNFETGTRAIAQAVADSDAIAVIGGGDSSAAVEQFGMTHLYYHISTGGGASLEYIEGRPLPGIDCLLDLESQHTSGKEKIYEPTV